MLARKSIKLQTSLSNPQHRGSLEVRTRTGEKEADVVSTRLRWPEEQVRPREECFGAGEPLRRRSCGPCARSSDVRGWQQFGITAH